MSGGPKHHLSIGSDPLLSFQGKTRWQIASDVGRVCYEPCGIVALEGRRAEVLSRISMFDWQDQVPSSRSLEVIAKTMVNRVSASVQWQFPSRPHVHADASGAGFGFTIFDRPLFVFLVD